MTEITSMKASNKDYSPWYAPESIPLLSKDNYHKYQIDFSADPNIQPAPTKIEYRYFKDGKYHNEILITPDGSAKLDVATGDKSSDTTGFFEFRIKALGPYGTVINVLSLDTSFVPQPASSSPAPAALSPDMLRALGMAQGIKLSTSITCDAYHEAPQPGTPSVPRHPLPDAVAYCR